MRQSRLTRGEDQRVFNGRQLDGAVDYLAPDREPGESADRYADGVRALRVNRRLMYRVVDNVGVRVLRLLHVNMDGAGQFRA